MSLSPTFDLAPDVDSRLIENGHFLFARGDRFFRVKPPTQNVVDFFTGLLKGRMPAAEPFHTGDKNLAMAIKFLDDRHLLGPTSQREPTVLIPTIGSTSTYTGNLAREIFSSLNILGLSDGLRSHVTILVSGVYDLIELGTVTREAKAKGETLVPVLLEHKSIRIGPIAAPGRCGCERCLYWRRVASARGCVEKLPSRLARAPVLPSPSSGDLGALVVQTIGKLLRSSSQVSWITHHTLNVEEANFLPISDCPDCLKEAKRGPVRS